MPVLYCVSKVIKLALLPVFVLIQLVIVVLSLIYMLLDDFLKWQTRQEINYKLKRGK